MRAALAKLLLLAPDMLLLDEPTNHLDLESTIWFERYLAGYAGAVIVVSHDREFLNRTVGKVLGIERKSIIFHRGNYDSYITARQQELEITEATAKRQELKIRKDERFIERFRAKNTKARQVQSRIKRLEKIERVVVPRTTCRINFSFPAPARRYFDAAGKSNRINPTPAKTFQLNNASESFQAPISIDTQRPEHQHR